MPVRRSEQPAPAPPPGGDDDACLVAALRRGDAAALRSLYDRYSGRLFAFLYRLTGRRDLADDLHQETWLAVASNAAGLRTDSDFAAWLFTIARNKHRSWGRWMAHRSRPAAGAVGDEQGPTDGSAPSAHEMERGLAALPAALREVLLLMGCEGLPAAQAAQILGISGDAVRQRLCRARAALLVELTREQAPLGPEKVLRLRRKVRGLP